MRLPCSSRLILLVLARIATGQIHPHFGIEAGVPLTDTLSSSSNSSTSATNSSLDRYNSETKRLLIGPSFRVDLQSGIGIEFDALYQRINYDHATVSAELLPTFFNRSFEQTTANRWQFPLLVQYTRTVSKSKTSLFVEAGPSISRIADSRSTISSTTRSDSSPSSSTSSITGQGGTWAGVVAGGGVDVPLFRVHVRPEFRYSHWFSQTNSSQAGFVSLGNFVSLGALISTSGIPSFRTKQNEASFLLGLTF
jgi:hypothetical protein